MRGSTIWHGKNYYVTKVYTADSLNSRLRQPDVAYVKIWFDRRRKPLITPVVQLMGDSALAAGITEPDTISLDDVHHLEIVSPILWGRALFNTVLVSMVAADMVGVSYSTESQISSIDWLKARQGAAWGCIAGLAVLPFSRAHELIFHRYRIVQLHPEMFFGDDTYVPPPRHEK